MSDIRKREGKNGTTYQVRYSSPTTKSGYAYKTFPTRKRAIAFREDAAARQVESSGNSEIKTVIQAVDKWLEICEYEGTDGNEPVTEQTLKTYARRAKIMKEYIWPKPLNQLGSPDIVEFRSWLQKHYSTYIAHKTLSSFHTVLKEMVLRGAIKSNVASGISIKATSRYDEELPIPSVEEVQLLLKTADELAHSSKYRVAKTWRRYRPMLYLAIDSGMRPQEYLALGIQHLTPNGVRVERAIEKGGKRISVTKTPAGKRFIELSAKTLSILEEYKKLHRKENEHDFLFPSEAGTWVKIEHWRKRGFYKVCEAAGLGHYVHEDGKTKFIPKYTPKSLRHFYASMLIHEKENFKKITRLLGHQKIETTINIYGHLITKVEDESNPRMGMLDRIH